MVFKPTMKDVKIANGIAFICGAGVALVEEAAGVAKIPLGNKPLKDAEIVVDIDNAYLGWWTWFLHSKGYVFRSTRSARSESHPRGKHVKVYLHRLVMGVTDPAIQVDHLHGNKLDNRRAFLERVDVGTNSRRMHSRTKGITYINPSHNAPSKAPENDIPF